MTEQDDFESTRKALNRLAAVPDPDPLRRASARRAFLEQASRLRAGPAAGRLARSGRVPAWFRLAAAAACALGLALAGMTGAAYAADAARPGDLLYPLDREMERVQLMLAPDQQQRASLLLSAAGERLQEAESLASQGDQQHLSVALENYSQAVANASQAVESDKGAGHPALVDRLDQTLSAHEQRLETIRQAAPEPAQPGLDHAIDAARRGHQAHPTAEPTQEATPDGDPSNPGNRPDSTPVPSDDHGPRPTEDRRDNSHGGQNHGHGGQDNGGHHNGGNHHR